MKRVFALVLALVSGAYLAVLGPLVDPLPVLDEAVALLVFVQALAALGVDVRRWLPMLGKKVPAAGSTKPAGRTVDV
jgi:hypothetical protein